MEINKDTRTKQHFWATKGTMELLTSHVPSVEQAYKTQTLSRHRNIDQWEQ